MLGFIILNYFIIWVYDELFAFMDDNHVVTPLYIYTYMLRVYFIVIEIAIPTVSVLQVRNGPPNTGMR